MNERTMSRRGFLKLAFTTALVGAASLAYDANVNGGKPGKHETTDDDDEEGG